MAKLKAGRVSREVADWCMQFMGGMGYAWENWISRAYRDFRLGSIGGGADEVMLQIIARRMGLDQRRGRNSTKYS
jgi:citronellyl-CoA dehydrogenase